MEDGHSGNHQAHSQKKPKKVTFTITFSTITKIAIAAAGVALLAAVYFAGARHGKEQQKASQRSGTTQSGSRTPSQNRWSAIGTVQEISDTSIKVKDSRGKEQQATINKDTAITDKTAKKIELSAVKKDSKVIVSGTKDDKGKLTATRIRLTK